MRHVVLHFQVEIESREILRKQSAISVRVQKKLVVL